MIKSLTDPDNPLSPKLIELVQRAEAGDQTVLPLLRQYLDEVPRLWKEYGDLALQAKLAWIGLISGENAASRECLSRQTVKLKADILEGSPAPLEVLLSDRIVVCWLQVYYSDIYYAQMRSKLTDGQLRALDSLQDRAHRRYLTAIKQLALVRKLLRPQEAKTPTARQTRTKVPAPLPDNRPSFRTVATLNRRPTLSTTVQAGCDTNRKG